MMKVATANPQPIDPPRSNRRPLLAYHEERPEEADRTVARSGVQVAGAVPERCQAGESQENPGCQQRPV